MKIKRICFVIPEGLPVPAVKGGAIETLIEQIINKNEKNKKFLITVICVNNDLAKEKAKKYKYTEFVNIGMYKKTLLYSLKNNSARVVKKTINIKIPILKKYDKMVEKYLISNANKFDLIINESSNFYAFKKVAKIVGKDKLVAHLHCYVKADKYLDDSYGNIITVSEYIKNKWLETSKIDKTKVHVLKNGISTEKFIKGISIEEKNKLRKQLNLCEDDFIVLYCGRIVPVKGIKELMQAIIKIKNKKVKLLIIGSPKFGLKEKSKYLKDVENIVAENKEKILFTGFIDNNLLYKYYEISNISVIPSVYEDPAPLVPIESMAAGKASIVTNSGGAWEYVTEACSIKVIKENNLIEQLSEKIEYLYKNKDLVKNMEKNSLIISKQYNDEKFYENFSNIINLL